MSRSPRLLPGSVAPPDDQLIARLAEANARLRLALPQLAMASLRLLGHRLGLGKSTELAHWPRPRLEAGIAVAFADIERIHGLIHSLDEVPKALLRAVCAAGGSVDPGYLQRQFVQIEPPPNLPAGSWTVRVAGERSIWERRLRKAIWELYARGLLIPVGNGREMVNYSASDITRIPAAYVWAHPCAGAWAGERDAAPAPDYTPQRATTERPSPLLVDIGTFLRLVKARPPKLLRAGGLRQAERKVLAKEWVGPAQGFDGESWFAWCWALVNNASLVRPAGENLHLTEAGHAFLTAEPGGQWLELWRAWLADESADDWRRVPEFHPDYAAAQWAAGSSHMQRLDRARSFFLRIFASFANGAWYSLDALSDAVRRINSGFLFDEEESPWHRRPFATYWYLRDGDGEIPRDEAGWRRVEGRYIGRLLIGPLAAFNAVQIDWDGASDRPDGFAVTASGRALLSGEPPVIERSEQPAAQVLPTGDVYVYPDRVEVQVLEALRGFCTHVGTDQVIHLRLEAASVRAALARGDDGDGMLAALERAAGGPLPQNLQVELLGWARRAAAITVLPSVDVGESLAGEGPATVIDYRRPLAPVSATWSGGRLRLHVEAGQSAADWELQRLLRWLDAEQTDARTWTADLANPMRAKAGAAAPDAAEGELRRRRWLDADGYPRRPMPAGEAMILTLAHRSPKGGVAVPVRLALMGWGGAGKRLKPAVRPMVELKASSAEWLNDVLSLPEGEACLAARPDRTTAVLDAEKAAPLFARLRREFGWELGADA